MTQGAIAFNTFEDIDQSGLTMYLHEKIAMYMFSDNDDSIKKLKNKARTVSDICHCIQELLIDKIVFA